MGSKAKQLTRRQFLVATGALAAIACTPTGPGGGPQTSAAAGKPTPGGTITFVLENDVIDFDPVFSRAFVDRNAHYQIYDTLARADENGKIIPWLAEKWDIAADGKTVTFSLRKDVVYHDGTPFDAASVKWNIERYQNTPKSARVGELASVASVDAVDQFTARFNLKAPFAPLLANLVDRSGMMLSKKAVDAGGADFTRNPIGAGSGPFKFIEAKKDDHVTLEKNASYWGKDKDGNKLPYLDKIVIKPITNSDVRFTNLRTGDAQVANNITGKDIAPARADTSLVYKEKPSFAFDSLIPNEKPGFLFNDHRLVKAVSMALDRREILERWAFGAGAVAYGTIAPSHFAFDPNFKPFEKPDPDGAKKVVTSVGKGPLEFELLVSAGDPSLVQLASLIQAQLAKADIKMNLNQLEFAQILKLQDDHTFTGMTLIGWSGRVDPDGNTYDHVYTGRPNNDSNYSNPQVDKLLDESRATFDQDKRKTAFRAAEQIYAVDDPARAWYRFRVSQVLTTKNLQGLEAYPDSIVRFQYGWLQR